MTKQLFEDTDSKTLQKMTEVARITPIWKKLQQVADTSAAMKQFAIAGLRRRYPQANEGELKQRLAAILLDREIVVKMYGWDPKTEGY
jgi:hypothetical protein